jgi:transcriptional regulator with XRE-family HTH domain
MTDSTDLKVIGAQLRAYRVEQVLTQHVVAERAGVDVNTVRYVEAGTRNTSLATLQRIAGVLGYKLVVEIVTSEPAATSTQETLENSSKLGA